MKYRPIMQKLLSNDFLISRKNDWIYAEQSNDLLKSGWKIHITATPGTAPVVLSIAIPILDNHKSNFKICSSSDMLNDLNGRTGPQTQAGKFMTIYPDSRKIQTLAKELVKSLDGLVGPDVPTDQPLKKGSIVSYRYGAFKNQKKINENGEIEYIYKDGEEDIVDQRNVYFTPPINKRDPFIDTTFDDSIQFIGKKYDVYAALTQSPKGGVYLAKDNNNKDVVIKEARKWTGHDKRGFESRTSLALEFIMLLQTNSVPGTPDAIDFFIQDGNAYLVQEHLSGIPLINWILEAYQSKKNIDLKTLSKSIRRLIRGLHKHQIIHRDISPNNILVVNESSISLIDMEFSIYEPLKIDPIKSGTPGYIAPWIKDGVKAQTKDDWYAVTQIFFTLKTLTVPTQGMSNNSKIKLLNLVDSPGLSRDLYKEDLSVELANTFIENELMKSPAENWVGPGASWSLHNGLAGIILVSSLLKIHLPRYSISESTISEYINALHESMDNTILEVNGLHFGPGGVGLSIFLAGIAWGRNDWLEKGIAIVSKSCESQLRKPKHFDWTHGAAGLLHASLIIYNHTNDSYFLNIIYSLEKQILENSSYIGNSLYWKSKLDNNHHVGFAHGISGIGYVLESSFRVTENTSARDTVLNIFNTLYNTQTNSMWKTSVENSEAQFFWCHGSPGIIHFLISILDWKEDALTLAEQAACKMNFMNGVPPLNRCHGIISLTAAYHDLYQKTKNEIHKESEINTLIFVNELRESVNVGPGWMGDMYKIDNPSLMTGSLGVAYSILQEKHNIPDPVLLREYLPK